MEKDEGRLGRQSHPKKINQEVLCKMNVDKAAGVKHGPSRICVVEMNFLRLLAQEEWRGIVIMKCMRQWELKRKLQE